MLSIASHLKFSHNSSFNSTQENICLIHYMYLIPLITDLQPYTEYMASLNVCTEVGCTASSNTSIMMPEAQPEGMILYDK